MELLLTLIPIAPFAGFLVLALFGGKMSRKAIAWVGAGSVVLAALMMLALGGIFLSSVPQGQAVVVKVWEWMSTGGLSVAFALRLDALSLVFIFVITFVGALIHIYSVEFMSGDDGYARFFASMNLFVSSMLILVLADNLLLLYLGWEGVGLCSYLLIGFWYKDPVNGYAARKAFIVTRVGDVSMILGLFLLFIQLGTLDIQQLMQSASQHWAPGSSLATWSAILLLGGALGKSAQLPLQTWLPDAMAGPSPVSALIHAATMVTAGVYLIARTHVLFALAPAVQTTVAVIGALTLLVSGFSALSQHDLKRVLAYSTISQIGYMFLALGVGAWSAAIFHFMIHAFFKALLFLAGGVVILVLHEEHDIFKMGGLRKKMPAIFWTFLIGSASLSALPLVTAGFYSKDSILWYSWSASNGSPWLWAAGAAGAFITSLYTFRLVFLTFFGEAKTEPTRQPGQLMVVPLVILAFFSLFGGFVELPETLGGVHIFSSLLAGSLPETLVAHHASEALFQLLAAILSLSGIWLAYRLFYKGSSFADALHHHPVNEFFYRGWDFDRLYDILFVRPVVWLAEIDKDDIIDLFSKGLAKLTLLGNGIISLTQNGKLRWYVMALAIGIVCILTVMMSL